MSWYRSLKTSMPVMQAPQGSQYMDIGHNEFMGREKSGEELWYMDKGFRVHRHPAKEDFSHGDALRLEEFDFDHIAKGRYEPNTNRVSLVTYRNWYGDNVSYKVEEYIRKKIEESLDLEFNNPTIVEF